MRFSRRGSFALLLSFCACATSNELGNSSGGTGSLTSSSTSGSSNSSSSSSGESGGSAGAGGAGGIGGAGGANIGGMGGAGGGVSSASSTSSSSTSASSSSSSGMGGIGGMGGMGGGPTGTLVVMAGPTASGASFEPATGWTMQPLNFSFYSADIAPRMAGGALAVMRRSSGVAAENNELFWTTWTKATGFATPQKVGTFGFAQDGPATAPAGIASVMTFLGTDNKHYFAQNDDGNSFGAFGPIPAGMVQTQAFGPSATVLASDGVGVYAVYAGDNAQLYYSYKSSAGGAWGPSTQAPTSTVINTIRPFAFVDAALDLRIVYVRQSDNRICMVKLVTPQNSWTTEETIATATTSKQATAVEISPGGDIVITYHALINEGIHFVRGKDGAFASVSTVEVPLVGTSVPIIVRGLSGADAEIVYSAGGKVRHARVNGNGATASDVPGVTTATSVAATIVP